MKGDEEKYLSSVPSMTDLHKQVGELQWRNRRDAITLALQQEEEARALHVHKMDTANQRRATRDGVNLHLIVRNP